ncbi:MAG: DUF2062 domain-containing protein [Cardiobacteriaceae bacterium]|nr:DUF2062 domain-containing protein [Cardiobacteriaceae bacterium]
MKFFFKKILPKPDKVFSSKALKNILKKIDRSQIWQVNRYTVSMAAACGLFFGALPMVGQIPCAVFAAGVLRANVLLAAFFTLWSNPFTFPIVFYMNYRVGQWFFDKLFFLPLFNVDFSNQNLLEMKGAILFPLFGGSVFVGIVVAALGYSIINLLWRFSVWRYVQKRRAKYPKLLPFQNKSQAENQKK